ncbi:DNA-binding transcriptional regulator, LysR family [Loktanella atrilutea]|uniref:DNA-binding transcriptional regulator, LysR family n=1 Tax=Loktanella atrilutea TaxID=366533 RepID=A0A1M5FWD9_LOKAT|nr:LysR family transcriptional regulator [Loktanella atrilutea]SHF95786.1 DNA-binding transcriptional regulator, LysR family [Loktanella atrilutea]
MRTSDPLNGIAVFLAVARHLSFSRAAEVLEMSRPTVSAQVDQLERRLGVRLLYRSTRHLALTAAGQAFFDGLADVTEIVDAAERAAVRQHKVPAGTLNIAAPPDLSLSHLTPMIVRFMARNADIDIRLQLDNEAVNLIEQKLDLAIRGRLQIQENLITRKLGASPIVLCASPDYIARRGAPQTPEDLIEHRCLHFSDLRWGRRWHMQRGDDHRQIEIAPVFEVNDGTSLGMAALAGLGIALLPAFIVGDNLRAGRLIRVLDDWTVGDVPLHAVYPDNRLIARKVKTFVAFLAAEFRKNPDLNGNTPL